jgi:hypothetical protein
MNAKRMDMTEAGNDEQDIFMKKITRTAQQNSRRSRG